MELENFPTDQLLKELNNRTKQYEEILLYEDFIKILASWTQCKEVLYKQENGLWYNRCSRREETTAEVLEWLKGYYRRIMD